MLLQCALAEGQSGGFYVRCDLLHSLIVQEAAARGVTATKSSLPFEPQFPHLHQGHQQTHVVGGRASLAIGPHSAAFMC